MRTQSFAKKKTTCKPAATSNVEMVPATFLGLRERSGKTVVSSRDIARIFGKEHRRVLQDIRDIKVSERFGLHNFVQISYKDSYGRDQPEYLVTRDGFTIIAMGYTGDVAMQFKEAYITRFNEMEHVLLERQTAEWQQARIDGKKVRLAETDAIKQLVEYAKAQGSEHADKLYMTYSKLVKQLTGYDKRDAASTGLLYTVSVMERLIGGIIMQEMALNAGYKAIYQTAKGQLAAILHLWNTPLSLA